MVRCRTSNLDCYNRDACPHHAESKALPAKISPLGINLLFLSSGRQSVVFAYRRPHYSASNPTSGWTVTGVRLE